MLQAPRHYLATAAVLLALATSAPSQAGDLIPAPSAKPAPQTSVSLPDVKGGNATLASFKGQVVLLDFWASWCGPCRESFPWMNDLQQRYGAQGLRVVGVNLDQEPEEALDFLQQVPAQFTVLLDTSAQLPDAFGVMGMPSSYLIDRNGKIRAQHVGFHHDRAAAYEQTIKTLLAE